MAKKKLKPTDGLGPLEVKKLRAALRLVWHRSHPRKLVVNRCIGADGFFRCEKCKRKTPQIKIDHKTVLGSLDRDYIQRLFCSSKELQGLCKKCHDVKTKKERTDDKESWGF